MLALLAGASLVQAQSAQPPLNAADVAEMRAKVVELRKQIDSDNRHVLHLQALARKEKDVIKLTCINDKLVQLKAQMNLFDLNNLALEGALDKGDDSPTLIFNDVEKATGDVKKLRGEADGCAGALDMYKQESKSDFERPDLDDPTAGEPFNPPDEPEVDVPAFATPYR